MARPSIDSNKTYRVRLARTIRMGKNGDTIARPRDEVKLPGYMLSSLPEDSVESYEEV